ncbi:MAG: hypothetical protein IJM26_09705, partial [Lachnospiraceae bacterium]|nr:hypothetical protein [Lachnospiraceae bacterium]
KKPERRYPNVVELIADLKRAVRTPNGDFVTQEGLVDETSSTVVLTEAQLNDIKKSTGMTTAEAAAAALARRKESG